MSETLGDAATSGGSSRSERAGDRRPPLPARIALFYRQVVAELRKVIWPTRNELITYTSVVIVFVVVFAAIVGVFDFIFAKGVLAVFGGE